MEISRWIGLVLSVAFPAWLLFWAVVRFRQRKKSPSMNAAGLDGGRYQPNAVAASVTWQQQAGRVAQVLITLDIDADGCARSPAATGQPADQAELTEKLQQPDTES